MRVGPETGGTAPPEGATQPGLHCGRGQVGRAGGRWGAVVAAEGRCLFQPGDASCWRKTFLTSMMARTLVARAGPVAAAESHVHLAVSSVGGMAILTCTRVVCRGGLASSAWSVHVHVCMCACAHLDLERVDLVCGHLDLRHVRALAGSLGALHRRLHGKLVARLVDPQAALFAHELGEIVREACRVAGLQGCRVAGLLDVQRRGCRQLLRWGCSLRNEGLHASMTRLQPPTPRVAASDT